MDLAPVPATPKPPDPGSADTETLVSMGVEDPPPVPGSEPPPAPMSASFRAV